MCLTIFCSKENPAPYVAGSFKKRLRVWLGASFDVGIAAVNCAELDAGYGKFGIFAV